MTRESDLETRLLSAQVRRLERALAQLASETHAMSRPEQLERKGHRELAEVVRDHRSGRLETAISIPEETR